MNQRKRKLRDPNAPKRTRKAKAPPAEPATPPGEVVEFAYRPGKWMDARVDSVAEDGHLGLLLPGDTLVWAKEGAEAGCFRRKAS